MLKIKTIIISILACATFLVMSIVPVSAVENHTDTIQIEDTINKPLWWPGNPNPKPGSEAWLQMYGYKAPKDASTARRCALQALKNTLIPSAAEAAVATWMLKHAFSVSSFAISFGLNFAYNYYTCI